MTLDRTMTQHHPEAKDEAVEGTRPGNYFVSNYPPYAYWGPENCERARQALNHPPRPETPLGMYVHIPFCRKRCHFCYFKVYTGTNHDQVNEYVKRLLGELGIYLALPMIGGRGLDFLYFGGGTPSFLSREDIRLLFEGIRKRSDLSRIREITFECEPGTITRAKLETLHEVGVTRLSLGVENFDAHVLEINGRAHRTDEIYRAFEAAQDVGFDQINIDLIAGMLDETESNWTDTVSKAIELGPDSVTIYQMEIPFNTTIYKRMRDEGSLTAPVADWTVKRHWVDEAFKRFESAGYTVSSAYTVVKDPTRTRFMYRDLLWRGADLFSLGVASFSHVNGIHYQNHQDIETYQNTIDQGGLPIFRALEPTDDERLIREFILQLKLGTIDSTYFSEKFGVRIEDRFKDAIASLDSRGFLDRSDPGVQLTRDALLQVDGLLTQFFNPEHRDYRHA